MSELSLSSRDDAFETGASGFLGITVSGSGIVSMQFSHGDVILGEIPPERYADRQRARIGCARVAELLAMPGGKKTASSMIASCENMLAQHEKLKKTRGRGSETQGAFAFLAYLRALEKEFETLRGDLDAAWSSADDDKNFRKCMRHADRAQQRLHRSIKKLTKKVKTK